MIKAFADEIDVGENISIFKGKKIIYKIVLYEGHCDLYVQENIYDKDIINFFNIKMEDYIKELQKYRGVLFEDEIYFLNIEDANKAINDYIDALIASKIILDGE